MATVAAWLSLWTPPRDAVVPPVPVARLVAGALATVAVLGAVAAVALPRLEAGKDRVATREREALALARGERRKRLAVEQRARRARLPAGATRAWATGEGTRAVVAALAAAVTADARERVRSGELRGPILGTRCLTFPPGTDARRHARLRSALYTCTAIRARVVGGVGAAGRRRGVLGYPFRVRVDRARGRFAWCKLTPLAGERSVPHPDDVVELPTACRAER